MLFISCSVTVRESLPQEDLVMVICLVVFFACAYPQNELPFVSSFVGPYPIESENGAKVVGHLVYVNF